MRKWDESTSPFAEPSPLETEIVRHRARAFRRWLARGADPGGLRALAGEQAGGAQAGGEHAATRDLATARGADEAHLAPPPALEQPAARGA